PIKSRIEGWSINQAEHQHEKHQDQQPIGTTNDCYRQHEVSTHQPFRTISGRLKAG
ncbi:hypothetical protein A2U01_0077615, partial [Trifolium medium]|nr:hypothetical protein [Trifolium medium]